MKSTSDRRISRSIVGLFALLWCLVGCGSPTKQEIEQYWEKLLLHEKVYDMVELVRFDDCVAVYGNPLLIRRIPAFAVFDLVDANHEDPLFPFDEVAFVSRKDLHETLAAIRGYAQFRELLPFVVEYSSERVAIESRGVRAEAERVPFLIMPGHQIALRYGKGMPVILLRTPNSQAWDSLLPEVRKSGIPYVETNAWKDPNVLLRFLQKEYPTTSQTSGSGACDRPQVGDRRDGEGLLHVRLRREFQSAVPHERVKPHVR